MKIKQEIRINSNSGGLSIWNRRRIEQFIEFISTAGLALILCDCAAPRYYPSYTPSYPSKQYITPSKPITPHPSFRYSSPEPKESFPRPKTYSPKPKAPPHFRPTYPRPRHH